MQFISEASRCEAAFLTRSCVDVFRMGKLWDPPEAKYKFGNSGDEKIR